jgi:hypothetical protein
VEELVELAHLEEQDGVEVVRLQIPPLALSRLVKNRALEA